VRSRQGGGPEAARIEETGWPEEGREEDVIEEDFSDRVSLSLRAILLESGSCCIWPLTGGPDDRGLKVGAFEEGPVKLASRTPRGDLRSEIRTRA
jgi:hypothetical protein